MSTNDGAAHTQPDLDRKVSETLKEDKASEIIDNGVFVPNPELEKRLVGHHLSAAVS